MNMTVVHPLEKCVQALLNLLARERLLMGHGIVRVSVNVHIGSFNPKCRAEQEYETGY